jgi:hypothetical protein
VGSGAWVDPSGKTVEWILALGGGGGGMSNSAGAENWQPVIPNKLSNANKEMKKGGKEEWVI